MHFVRVNVTFYDAFNMIHYVITTANLFPYTAKLQQLIYFHILINYRRFSKLKMSSFLNDLSSISFDVLEIIVNPDDALKYFYNCLNSLLVEHIPIKEKRVKKPKQPDWFND